MAKKQVLRVLIGCNRQLLLIKIYAGISNIFKIVHHLLKLRASNKGIKQMLFLLFSNFLNENKEVLKKYTDVWNGIKREIKAINGGKENDYGKDYTNIKFNSDDDLPINKPLKFYAMTIIIRSVFEEDGKVYLQVFLDDTLYEV